jgi:dihydroorotase
MKTFILGTIVEEGGVAPSLITIEDGKITNVAILNKNFANDVAAVTGKNVHTYDFEKYLIFPGFVDIHTHCREDESRLDCHKEEYATVGLAALSGGVTFVADMPNNPVVPLTKETYDRKQRIALSCPVDVLCYAGVGPSASPFPGYFAADPPYKVFLGPSTRSEDALHFRDYTELSATLARYKGKSVSFHCEDPALLEANKTQLTHEERRPVAAERMAIEIALDFVEMHHLQGKVCHVSTVKGMETIHDRRGSSCNVTMEVTPHHLFFDIEMLTAENRRFLQMNPPLRKRQERLALIEGLKNGWFDFLATDHAPHTAEEKLRGISGVPQLDTYGPFVAWLIKEQKVDPVTIFHMACQNPGAWIEGFTGRKVGRIMPGYEASITVLNMTKSPVEGRPLFTKCGWSPFDLRSLPGMVETVYLLGEKVVDGLYVKDFK